MKNIKGQFYVYLMLKDNNLLSNELALRISKLLK